VAPVSKTNFGLSPRWFAATSAAASRFSVVAYLYGLC